MTKTSKGTRGMTATGAARKDVIAFFDNMFERRFTDAERAIEKVKERKINTQEFKEGYVKALEGMLLSCRSGDDRDFYNRELSSVETRKYRKFFREYRKKGIRTPFDIGFFSAWSDLMKYRSAYKIDAED